MVSKHSTAFPTAQGSPQAAGIRPASPADAEILHEFIHSLAEEEGFAPLASQGDLEDALFGNDACAWAVIVEIDDRPAGFALLYPKYATVSGRRGLHLEDFYVKPEFRNRGLGGMVMSYVADAAGTQGFVDWWVLRSNSAAIRFYERLGAAELGDIAVYRLDSRSF